MLGCTKNKHIIAEIIEEGITDANLGKGVTDQIAAMAQIGLIVDPIVDHTRPGQGRIAVLNILADR